MGPAPGARRVRDQPSPAGRRPRPPAADAAATAVERCCAPRSASASARWPTPRGTFIIRNRLERYQSPQYGPVAFGTSARSPTLTDWPAGGFIGIHGTDRPDLLPGRVSHGCVRLRNADILRLARLMPVGTPVEFR